MTEQSIPIQNSDQLVCKVWKYDHWHSRLLIRIEQEPLNPLYWLVFLSVSYISLRPSWHGANFYVVEDDRYLNLARTLYTERFDEIAQNYKLYLVKPIFPKMEFYILAASYSLRDGKDVDEGSLF